MSRLTASIVALIGQALAAWVVVSTHAAAIDAKLEPIKKELGVIRYEQIVAAGRNEILYAKVDALEKERAGE